MTKKFPFFMLFMLFFAFSVFPQPEIVFQEWHTASDQTLQDFWINGFSKDEKFLLTASFDENYMRKVNRIDAGEVKVWDTETVFLVHTIKNVRTPRTYCFLPDSNKIVCQFGKDIAYYDILDKKYHVITEDFLSDSEYKYTSYSGAIKFAISPDNQYLYAQRTSYNSEHTITAYSIHNFKLIEILSWSSPEYDKIKSYFRENEIIFGRRQEFIKVEAPSGKTFMIRCNLGPKIIKYDYETNNIYILSEDKKNILIFDNNFSYLRTEIENSYNSIFKQKKHYNKRSHSGTFLYYNDRGKSYIYNIKTNKKKTIKERIISFSQNDTLCISVSGNIYDTTSWKIVKSIPVVSTEFTFSLNSPNFEF